MKQIRMPSWPQYQQMTDDERDRLYIRWCRAQGIELETEGSGDAFVGSMPNSDMTDQSDREDVLDRDD
jgi:hypothetical protein